MSPKLLDRRAPHECPHCDDGYFYDDPHAPGRVTACMDCRERIERERGRAYTVAVYHVDRVYGGSEEGGWYYDAGELIRPVRTFRREEPAYEYARRLNARLRGLLNAGRPPIGSTRSQGIYQAHVYAQAPPPTFPERRPRYE